METSPKTPPSLDEFDLEKYIRASVGTRPESFDWSDPGPPLDEESLFCLVYMLDIEAHTIIYLRELLSTTIAEDPSITAFLSCWNYEEFCHSRTLIKLLETQGVRIDNRHFSALRRRSPGDRLAQQIARIASMLTGHFPAIHMTWGAINELTAVYSYQALSRRAQHPLVTTVLAQIIKDERRHFSFYFNQARIRLQPRAARVLTSFALRRFWKPVGGPVRGDADLRRVHDHLSADEIAIRHHAELDATIARLPGLEWFDLMSRYGAVSAPACRISGPVGTSEFV